MTTRLPYRAGLAFGAVAFLAGAVLGPLRELALAPRLGGLAAAWIEAAAMAFLLWLAARATVQPGSSLRDRALIAALALTIVLLAEAALSWIFAATGLAAARAPRGAAEQVPGLVLLLWLVALPFLRRTT
ncbi:hypothetical protein [Falsiroseomonas bella]|uniref:hypothetical protein n=1 Tax=Falsiroseomonas bella TaxID=2184016 RepID=UPI0011B3B054|nr:hypothetical protein [Falsiroseomonas bella]